MLLLYFNVQNDCLNDYFHHEKLHKSHKQHVLLRSQNKNHRDRCVLVVLSQLELCEKQRRGEGYNSAGCVRFFFLFFFFFEEGILFSEKRKQENEKLGERKGERNEKEVEVWRKGETKKKIRKEREWEGMEEREKVEKQSDIHPIYFISIYFI